MWRVASTLTGWQPLVSLYDSQVLYDSWEGVDDMAVVAKWIMLQLIP
jgi:hypothetical protein